MPDVVKDTAALRKRLNRLLFHNMRPDRPELHRVILPQLGQVGSLALIGGAIRDVALRGGETFRSDLDFVLFQSDRPAFAKLMTRLGARENKFGGYGIRFPRWKVDIWAIETTWAHTAGHRHVEHIEDLLDCTFFNWDAALFTLEDRRLILAENYLNHLHDRVLEVNLLENPNPSGALVRAIRRGRRWKAHFGERLTDFALSELRNHDWRDLVDLEKRAFGGSYLEGMDHGRLIANLNRPMFVKGQYVTQPFDADPNQLEFAL